MNLPRTAYVLLWFPKPSETFVFREVVNLRKAGLPLKVFTLYSTLTQALSEEMRGASADVERLGIRHLGRALAGVLYWWKRDRKRIMALFREVLWRRWRGLEKSGESLWAFLCAFWLARRFEEERIEHIHAPWASGPATAAWVASRLTGIPFSFTCRAWDIYPPDSALCDKLRDAAFVRSETEANIQHLATTCEADTAKIHLTYNGVPLVSHAEAPVAMQPPYRLLAMGRFVGKKGYEFLLHACKHLADDGVDFHLTLAGDGARAFQLKRLARDLGLGGRVSFPGFVSYDAVSGLFRAADIFIMPSVVHASGDRDGIPTVIMEALTHRVPVIATNVSGIPELIEDGVTGLLIPEKDPAAIARAALRLINDRSAALAMAEQGRAKVRELFDPERNHKKVLELYQTLVAR
ncbi:MAG: glycosyltransferase [Verrucomicrobia bacterium]|nr:glycosyltransferase [Verrucomicrobiota bacterium]